MKPPAVDPCHCRDRAHDALTTGERVEAHADRTAWRELALECALPAVIVAVCAAVLWAVLS